MTTEFLHEAEVQRDVLGMHELVPVVIDHPLSTLTDEEIERRAEQAAGQCVDVWLGRPKARNTGHRPLTRAGGAPELRSVDESQQRCVFVGAVHGEPQPITAVPQIGEEAGAILVKVQKGLALEIKYPGPPLDESNPASQALQQIAESV